METVTLIASEAERAAMLKQPEQLMARAEHVLSGMLQKMRKLEAERAAERVDHEAVQQQLESSFAALREDRQRFELQYTQANVVRNAAVEARNTVQAEVARLSSELRASEAEVARAKEAEREAREARKQMSEISERRVRHPPARGARKSNPPQARGTDHVPLRWGRRARQRVRIALLRFPDGGNPPRRVQAQQADGTEKELTMVNAQLAEARKQ
eukprot:3375512-Prymnesium_polylepis.1